MNDDCRDCRKPVPAEHTKWMSVAFEEAVQAYEEGEIPIGAAIVYRPEGEAAGRLIARAHNRVEALSDPTAHAEMLAITMATDTLGGKYLSDCILYVTIEPCTMCAGAMRWAQVKTVVFGAGEPKVGYRVLCPNALHPRCIVIGGVMEDECKQLMQNFFKSKRLAK
ncbi:tRNA-specific adenosine deaminase [Porphyromonas macacae]|uniref:tRNA-specific adenosine deaminase n=1 Tax=Porphyromonas macacae TaxID=28115 RepID=A0A379E936_9PORP|nr:nucleoside deaminase [Porphyromonas macacae]SUB89059.1 tRNA-specific adenosine deaminase [Porphyromonas macacae]